jgi:hypothetical protein
MTSGSGGDILEALWAQDNAARQETLSRLEEANYGTYFLLVTR